MRNKELKLADQIVRANGSVPHVVTVKQIKDNEITFFRPYTQTGDFSYTGGVICYIGVEEWTESVDSSSEWTLLERKTLK